MKIRFLSGLAGMDAAGALIFFSVGDVIDWNDEEAERLIGAGIAEESNDGKDSNGSKNSNDRKGIKARG